MTADPDAVGEGALTAEGIGRLIREGGVRSDRAIEDDQIQPASLDLRLSDEGYRLPGSVLPLRGESVRDLLHSFRARPIDLSRPMELDRGRVYLVRAQESLALPPTIGAYSNNKSSIGRIDVQTRTLSDGNPRYDKHARGTAGEIWIEILSKSFDLRVRAGVRLNQVIFYGRRRVLDDREIDERHHVEPLLLDRQGRAAAGSAWVLDQGVLLSVDLDQEIAGWVARRAPEPLILDEPRSHDPSEFFDPIARPRDGRLLLARDRFYILSTAERVRVPNDLAVEMLPYETTAGEFRAHYAGFFDPGFGYGEDGAGGGTVAVLEVRAYDDDLLLRHTQPICKLAYERLTGQTTRSYGRSGSMNHYAAQKGPCLSRYFR